MFTLKQIGMVFGTNSTGLTNGKKATFTVTGVTSNNTTVTYNRFAGTPEAYHINNQVFFEGNNEYNFFNNQIKTLKIRIDIPANTLDAVATISQIYVNGVTSNGASSAFAYIGGDKFGGDIEFHSGSGLVIKSPDGNRWRLTVSNTGTVSSTKLT